MSLRDTNYLNNIQKIKDKYNDPNEYIKDFTKSHPEYKEKVLNLLKKGTPSSDVAKALVYIDSTPTLGQEYTSSLKRAYYSDMASLDKIWKMLGINVPSAEERATQWEQQAQNIAPDKEYSLLHPNNATDFTHAVAQNLGSLSEFLLSMAIGGGEGKLLTKGITKAFPTLLEKKALESVGKDVSKEAIDKATKDILAKSAETNAKIGAMANVSAPEIGREYANQPTNDKSAIKATLGGLATGALYTLSPFELLGKGISKEVTKVLDMPDIVKKYSGNDVVNTLSESVKQSAILGGASLTSQLGSNQPINTQETIDQATLGAILGLGGKLISNSLKSKLDNSGNKIKKDFENLAKENKIPALQTEQRIALPLYKDKLPDISSVDKFSKANVERDIGKVLSQEEYDSYINYLNTQNIPTRQGNDIKTSIKLQQDTIKQRLNKLLPKETSIKSDIDFQNALNYIKITKKPTVEGLEKYLKFMKTALPDTFKEKVNALVDTGKSKNLTGLAYSKHTNGFKKFLEQALSTKLNNREVIKVLDNFNKFKTLNDIGNYIDNLREVSKNKVINTPRIDVNSLDNLMYVKYKLEHHFGQKLSYDQLKKIPTEQKNNLINTEYNDKNSIPLKQDMLKKQQIPQVETKTTPKINKPNIPQENTNSKIDIKSNKNINIITELPKDIKRKYVRASNLFPKDDNPTSTSDNFIGNTRIVFNKDYTDKTYQQHFMKSHIINKTDIPSERLYPSELDKSKEYTDINDIKGFSILDGDKFYVYQHNNKLLGMYKKYIDYISKHTEAKSFKANDKVALFYNKDKKLIGIYALPDLSNSKINILENKINPIEKKNDIKVNQKSSEIKEKNKINKKIPKVNTKPKNASEIIKSHLDTMNTKIREEKDLEEKKKLFNKLQQTLKDKGVPVSLIKTNLQALDRHIKSKEKEIQQSELKNKVINQLLDAKSKIKELVETSNLSPKINKFYSKDNKLYMDITTTDKKNISINLFDPDNINKLKSMEDILKENNIKIKPTEDLSVEDIKEDYVNDLLELKKELNSSISKIDKETINNTEFDKVIHRISDYILVIDDLSYFVSDKDLLKFKLDDNGIKTIKDFDKMSSILEKDLFNSFNINNLLDKIFGKELSKKINIKNINNITIEDLGGRENIITALKDYGIDATNYTDEQIKNTIKRIKGFSFFNANDKSTLIGIATSDDNIKRTLYHELFHIIDNYKLLSKEDINTLKKHSETIFKDDPREWNEKIADDFSAYLIDNIVHTNDPVIIKIYKQIKRFINRIKLKFKKRNAQDIYRDLIEGKYNKDKMPASDLAFYYKRLSNASDIYNYNLSNSATIQGKFEQKINENSGRDNFTTYKDFARKVTSDTFTHISTFLKDFTGGLSPELHTKDTLKEENIIRKLASVKSISIGDAVRAMKEITNGFTKEDKILFEKHLIINDIIKSLESHIQTFSDINHQWGNIFKNESDLYYIKDKINKEVDANKKIKIASIKRKKLYNDIFNYLINNNIIDETAYDKLDTDNYFHRIRLLDFKMKIKTNGSYLGSLPKTDPLIDRVKSIDPYITNYIYSDLESFAQFYNLKRVHQQIKDLRSIGNNYLSMMMDDLNRIKKQLKRKKTDTDATYSKKVIERINYLAKRNPNGYFGKKYLDKNFKPIYSLLKISDIPHFYSIWTISDDMAQALLNGTLTEKEIKNLEPHLATGIKKYDDMFIVNSNVIPALKRIAKIHTPSHIEKMLQWNISKFKQFILFSPFRFPKYMLNNFTGDMDIAFAISPKILLNKDYAYKATKDLYDFYYKKGKNLEKEIKDELELARTELVIGSNITAEEVSRIDTFDEFKNMLGTKPTIFNIGSKYFSKVIKMNNYREDILRLATFRYYKDKLKQYKNIKDAHIVTTVDIDKLEQLKKSLGIDALAAKLAREAIGDYGNISPSGQWLRHNLIPFWSWTEINAPRYIRIYRNLIKESKSQALLSATFKTALLTSKITTLYALIQLWNMTMFPDVNDAINEENNGQLHLILPRLFADKDSPYYTTVRFSGALSDALDWIGLGNLGGTIDKMIKGEMTPLDVFKKVPSNALNKFINMSAPIQKTAIEDILGLSFFPDVANPRPVRDKLEHTLKIVGLGLPYKMLFSGQPTQYSADGILAKSFGCIFNSIFYTTDLDSTNYYIVKQYVQSFLKEKNIQRPIMSATDKSNYAVSYRKALLYGDKQLAIKYLALYYSLGGTLQSMKRSLKYANPIAGIPKNMVSEFYKSLSPEDLIKVKKAEIWYKKIYLNKGKFSPREKYEIVKNAWNLYLKLKKSK